MTTTKLPIVNEYRVNQLIERNQDARPHRFLPPKGSRLIASIQHSGNQISWAVCAFEENVAYLIEYRPPITDCDGSTEGMIDSVRITMNRLQWILRNKDDVILVDSNYGKWTQYIRELTSSWHGTEAYCSFSRNLCAKDQPMSEWPNILGERRGDHASLRRETTLITDCSYWRTQVFRALEENRFRLFGFAPPSMPGFLHGELVSHLCGMKVTRCQSKNGRTAFEWDQLPRERIELFNAIAECFAMNSIPDADAKPKRGISPLARSLKNWRSR